LDDTRPPGVSVAVKLFGLHLVGRDAKAGEHALRVHGHSGRPRVLLWAI
jgi:hypothetical protein